MDCPNINRQEFYEYLMDRLAWCPECGEVTKTRTHFCESCKQRIPCMVELSEKAIEAIFQKLGIP